MRMKKIEFLVGKDTLVGHVFFPKVAKKKNKAFLIVHGRQSQQNRGFHLARALTRKGYIAMTFDLRGHGASDRKIELLSRKNFLDDVVSAYDFLAETKGVDTHNIVAVGSSFGGYLVSLLSAKRNVKALVLRVPANYQDKGFTKPQYTQRKQKARQEWKNRLQPHNACKSLRALHAFDGKVLIVESEKDELVPQTVVQSYANAVSHKKRLSYKIMKKAPHSISKHPRFQKEYKNLMVDWLK